MKVLISFILLFSIVNAHFFGKTIKVNFADCQKPMRETISRYVCFDNHMSVKKSDVVMNNQGVWVIDQKRVKESFNRRHGAPFYVGALLISGSGLVGLYMNNNTCDDCSIKDLDKYSDELKKLNNIRFGMLVVGGLMISGD